MALFIKSVMADAINEKMETSLRIASLAFNATSLVPEILSAGNEVNFPKFERVARVGDVTKGTALVPNEISMTENKASVQQVGGSIRVYDKDAKQIQGAVTDNMVVQLSDAMVQRIDGDLAKEMKEHAVKKSVTVGADSITAKELFDALGLFGDDIDTSSFAGIAINSRLYSSFLNMPEFTSVEKTYASMDNGKVVNGLIGYFVGIPVIVTNSGTYDSSLKECVTFVVKHNALGYIFQKDIAVEEEREAKLLCTDLVTSSLYAIKLINKDEVIVVRKTLE